MPTTNDFFDALVAVRDDQEMRTVGSFTFSPDNRMGRGFCAVQQIMRHDDLLGSEPSYMSPREGGMRNFPHTDAAMKRIAVNYALRDGEEMTSRA